MDDFVVVEIVRGLRGKVDSDRVINERLTHDEKDKSITFHKLY